MQPVPRERLHHRPDPRAVEDQPRPQVRVGRVPEGLIEAAGGEEALAPHGRQAEHEVAPEDRGSLVAGLERKLVHVAAAHGSSVELEQCVRGQDVEVWPRDRQLGERLEPLRGVQVVGVQDGEKLA